MKEIFETLKVLEEKAKSQYKLKKLKYKVNFDLKSLRILGRYSHHTKTISFNKELILKSGIKKYLPVVIHEFSHLVAMKVFGKYIKSHGKEWKEIMVFFGEGDPKATTKDFSKEIADLHEIKANCKCTIHGISSIRAKRIKEGKEYYCKKCKSKLKIL